jgi:ABC-2 type transport system permease protein
MVMVRETWLLFAYSMRITLRNPVWVVFGLFQPVLWLVLFAPLLDNLGAAVLPEGKALAVFTPGVLVLLALYGTVFVGYSLLPKIRDGVLERWCVTPVHRPALVLGRVLRDIAVLLVQSTLLLGIAWLMGLRASVTGVLLAMALVLLIGLFLASCSYALALMLRDENGLAAIVNFLTLPLVLLSGITLPLTLAPDWIQTVADVNPFSHAVDATRSLFAGDILVGAVLRGFLIAGVLALLALAWAVRAFRDVVA